MSNSKSNVAIIAAIGGIFVVLATVCAASYISAANKANQLERKLEGAYEKSEVVLGQYGQKVVETAQVTDLARDDIAKVAKEAIGGRYGKDGSKAVFQMITESNPTVDPLLYRQIQQVIEAGRNQFQTSQTTMIDIKRQYKEQLGTVWTGMWMGMAGYPKIDLEKFKGISTDRAQNAFQTGKESAPIKLR